MDIDDLRKRKEQTAREIRSFIADELGEFHSETGISIKRIDVALIPHESFADPDVVWVIAGVNIELDV